MKLRLILGAAGTSFLPVTALLLAYSSGPDPKLTGGFGEENCVKCHNSSQLNEGRTRGGILYIRGVPDHYEPGQSYPLTVVLGQPGQRRWGFELSARFAESGAQAGELSASDELVQVRSMGRIQYAQHTLAGTRAGSLHGPVEFKVNWVAPPPGKMGGVLFNIAGNASNGDNKPTGDYIYTASAYSSEGETVEILPVALQPGPTGLEGAQPRRMNNDPRVAHMGAPVDLKAGNFEVLIQHRFLGPIVSDGSLDAGTAFGVDFGANIDLGITYALSDAVNVSVSRERFDRRVSFSGTYEVLTKQESPFQLSVRGGVEGTRNFQDHYSGFLEVPAQWDYKAFRLNATPIVVFNSRSDLEAEIRPGPVNPEDNNTFALGLGTDIAFNRRLSLVAEYIPRLAGFGGFGIDRASLAGGLKIRTRQHVFHLLITNNRYLSPSRYAVNATTNDYAFGFNIYRRIGH